MCGARREQAVASQQPDYLHEALTYHKQALDYFQATQHLNNAAAASLNVGFVLYLQDDKEKARDAYSDALAWFERVESDRGAMLAHYNLGELALEMGVVSDATSHLNPALEMSLRSGEVAIRPHILFLLAQAATTVGNKAEATEHARAATLLIGDNSHPLARPVADLLSEIASPFDADSGGEYE